MPVYVPSTLYGVWQLGKKALLTIFATTREQLGEDAFRQRYQEGRSMDLDDVVKYAIG